MIANTDSAITPRPTSPNNWWRSESGVIAPLPRDVEGVGVAVQDQAHTQGHIHDADERQPPGTAHGMPHTLRSPGRAVAVVAVHRDHHHGHHEYDGERAQ